MEENATLNDREESSASNDTELISTVPEEAVPSDQTLNDKEEPGENIVEDLEKEEPKPDPVDEAFHKSARFQEMNERMKRAESLAAVVPQLQQQLAQLQSPRAPAKPSYKDITAMSPDELRDWQDTDPVEYATNLYAQIRSELMQELGEKTRQEQVQSSVDRTYKSYAEKNPDFDQMWQTGDLKRFMDENPGHNAISAHQVLTAEKRSQDIETKISEAVAKAVKETEQKLTKQFRAKRESASLPAGPAAKPNNGAPVELKEPNKFGGATSVLAQRLMGLRSRL